MFWKIVGILIKRARSKFLVGLDLEFREIAAAAFFSRRHFLTSTGNMIRSKRLRNRWTRFLLEDSFANFLSTVRRCRRRRRRRRWRPGCRRLSGRSTRWCRCCACSSQSTSAASSRQTSELTPAEGNAFESLPWFNYQWTLTFLWRGKHHERLNSCPSWLALACFENEMRIAECIDAADS